MCGASIDNRRMSSAVWFHFAKSGWIMVLLSSSRLTCTRSCFHESNSLHYHYQYYRFLLDFSLVSFAPLKSTSVSGFDSRHAFHPSTPALSRMTCVGSAITILPFTIFSLIQCHQRWRLLQVCKYSIGSVEKCKDGVSRLLRLGSYRQ